ncbi:MAG: hypothetical protein ACRDH6_02550 [Actinomycetota bacterium]
MSGWSNWTCLTSLRDVEPGINLVLDLDDLGDGTAPAFDFPPADRAKTGETDTDPAAVEAST